MNISVEMDPDDRQILSVYIKLREGLVFRTVEVAEGECNADEDEFGNLLGVELLCPGELKIHTSALEAQYPKYEGLREVLDAAAESIAV